LPDFFTGERFNEVSELLVFFENLFRLAFFFLAFLMPVTKQSVKKVWPWAVYVVGILLYFGCWVPLITNSSGTWSQSLPGLLAPSITPLGWMAGIILIGEGFSFGIPHHKWIPWIVTILFVFFHNLHVWLAFSR
jgi:hypothetical protein